MYIHDRIPSVQNVRKDWSDKLKFRKFEKLNCKIKDEGTYLECYNFVRTYVNAEVNAVIHAHRIVRQQPRGLV